MDKIKCNDFFHGGGLLFLACFSPSGELKRMAAQSKQSFDSSHAFTLYITHEEGRELPLISQLYTSTVLTLLHKDDTRITPVSTHRTHDSPFHGGLTLI